jgi:hypothetical protein
MGYTYWVVRCPTTTKPIPLKCGITAGTEHTAPKPPAQLLCRHCKETHSYSNEDVEVTTSEEVSLPWLKDMTYRKEWGDLASGALIGREVEILSDVAEPYGLTVSRITGKDGFLGQPLAHSSAREFTLEPGGVKVPDLGEIRTGADAEAKLRAHFTNQLEAEKQK